MDSRPTLHLLDSATWPLARDSYRLVGKEDGVATSSNRVPKTSTSRPEPLDSSNNNEGIGQPTGRVLLTWKESGLAALCLLCFAVAFISVHLQQVAFSLGQTYQLVVLGISLSIMAYCTRKSLVFLMICIETRSGPSRKTPKQTTLQNLDAILACDPLAERISWTYRSILLALLLVPLGLSAAYKPFTSGQSALASVTSIHNFGLTGPPGTQTVGYGMSLFINATLSWFFDPGFDRPYGFNMYIIDNETTAMIDGPLPADVQLLQTGLSQGQSLEVEATVRAFICKLNHTLAYDTATLNETFYDRLASGEDDVFRSFVYNASFFMGFMLPDPYTYTTVWFSWWSTLDPAAEQYFGDGVHQYDLWRQRVNARWIITANTIQLISAALTPASEADIGKAYLVDNYLAVSELFGPAMTEFNVKFRKYGHAYANNTKYDTYVHSDSALIASALWSRITALNGAEVWDPESDSRAKGYSIKMTSKPTRITMQRNLWLYLILAAQPIIMLISIVVRLAFYKSSPVGPDFGLTSLLSAADPRSLEILQGSSYSGKLSKRLALRFTTRKLVPTDAEDKHKSMEKIVVSFGTGGRNATLDGRTLYA